MNVRGGTVLFGLSMMLLLGILILADLVFSLAFNVVLILFVIYLLSGIGGLIEVIIDCIKTKKYKKLLIFFVIVIIFSLVPFENFYENLWGYKLYPIVHRLVMIGIVSWIILRIYQKEKEKKEESNEMSGIFLGTLMIIIVLGSIILHFTLGIDKVIFESVPTIIAEHNEKWYLEREVKNYNPKEELESILKVYKENPTMEVSKDEINKLTHTEYNGIWCFVVEDDGDAYNIGMAYKSSASFWESIWGSIFPSGNFGKVGSYKVDKTTFEIIETLNETFKGGRDYNK